MISAPSVAHRMKKHDGLWTVWTTLRGLRVAHTAHSPYDDGDKVGTFSIVKWVLFQLSRFRTKQPKWVIFRLSNGYFFG
jgi:hypothetical protein